MDKNTRICIIGGGPAGLSAGMYLEKKGYENYSILEKSDRVGGKCWSLTSTAAAMRWAQSWACPLTTPSTMCRSSAASPMTAPSSTVTTKTRTAR